MVCSHPKLWYVNTPYCFIPTPSCGMFASKTVVCSCLVFANPNCGRFQLDILPPQDVVCSHPKLWYVYTTNCGMFLFGILPSQIVVCSCLVCFHSELWYVPTPSCGVFPPNCGMFPSCDIFSYFMHLVFCHLACGVFIFQVFGMFPCQTGVCAHPTLCMW